MPKPSSHQGFTLLEVLLALAIFAMFSVGAYAVMQGVMTNNDVAKAKIARLSDIQRAVTLMSRDFQQIVPRPGRTNSENSSLVFQTDKNFANSDDWGVEFVHAGWLNPGAQLHRSELSKTVYRLDHGTLQRLVYLYPDMDSGIEPEITPLLTGVTSFSLRFYKDKNWQTEWTTPKKLPQAVEVTLQLTDYGTIQRILPIATIPEKTASSATSTDISDFEISTPTISSGDDQE